MGVSGRVRLAWAAAVPGPVGGEAGRVQQARDGRVSAVWGSRRGLGVPGSAVGWAGDGRSGAVAAPGNDPGRRPRAAVRLRRGRRRAAGPGAARDRDGQGYQVRDQRDHDQRGVAGDLAGQGHQPGSSPQPVPLARGPGDLAIPGAGGTVIAVRGPAQRRVLQGPCCDVQGVGRRPGGVVGPDRIAVGAPADVVGRCGGLAGRVAVDRVPFRDGAPERRGESECLGKPLDRRPDVVSCQSLAQRAALRSPIPRTNRGQTINRPDRRFRRSGP
jgi:hypothetical protein